MSATDEAKQLAASVVLRVIGLQDRAEAVEAQLLLHAEAGIKHPDLARALADSR